MTAVIVVLGVLTVGVGLWRVAKGHATQRWSRRESFTGERRILVAMAGIGGAGA